MTSILLQIQGIYRFYTLERFPMVLITCIGYRSYILKDFENASPRLKVLKKYPFSDRF